MPHDSPSSSLALSGIKAALTTIETQMSLLITEPGAGSRNVSAAQASAQLRELEQFTVRLREIQRLLEADPRLLPIVDNAIGRQVRAMEKRLARANTTVAAVTTVIGAILGWLLSAARSPQDIFMFLTHHP